MVKKICYINGEDFTRKIPKLPISGSVGKNLPDLILFDFTVPLKHKKSLDKIIKGNREDKITIQYIEDTKVIETLHFQGTISFIFESDDKKLDFIYNFIGKLVNV